MAKILVGVNDLRTVKPEVADQWHPKKNGSLSPEHLTAGSSKKAWWKRECLPGIFHEWESIIADRALRGIGCPVCAGKVVLVGYNDLGTTHPALAAEWHTEKNGLLRPQHLTAGSGKKAWWEKECFPGIFHEWETVVNNRALRGRSCSVCAGKTVLVGCNDLGTTHPFLAAEWHTKKNGPLTPQHLTAGSHKKVWWEKECLPGIFHEWQAVVSNRSLSCHRCSVCDGRTVQKGCNDLGTTHPVLATEWHTKKNGLLSPENFTAGSGKKAWWERECRPGIFHEWEAVVSNRALRGDGCPFCAGRIVLVGCNDLGTTYPALATEWHPEKNGSITSEHVMSGSNKKAWWKRECRLGIFHEWEAVVSNRALRGNDCPFCSTGKTETSFRESIEKQTGYDFQTNRIQLERLSRKRQIAQVDMINDGLWLIIEYDGAWAHGESAQYKATLEQKLTEDKETTEALIKLGYNVIRIREHDRRQKLPSIPIDPEYESSVFQITYKSFGKDKHDIDTLVKGVINAKADWFRAADLCAA